MSRPWKNNLATLKNLANSSFAGHFCLREKVRNGIEIFSSFCSCRMVGCVEVDKKHWVGTAGRGWKLTFNKPLATCGELTVGTDTIMMTQNLEGSLLFSSPVSVLRMLGKWQVSTWEQLCLPVGRGRCARDCRLPVFFWDES